jgi:hypothetical protein
MRLCNAEFRMMHNFFFLRKMNDYYTLESIVCTFVDGAGSSIGAVVVVVVLRPFEGMYRAPGIYRHSI